MKKILFVCVLSCILCFNVTGLAQQPQLETKQIQVKGYYRANGTYVAPHQRTIKIKKKTPKPVVQPKPTYEFDYDDHYKESVVP